QVLTVGGYWRFFWDLAARPAKWARFLKSGASFAPLDPTTAAAAAYDVDLFDVDVDDSDSQSTLSPPTTLCLSVTFAILVYSIFAAEDFFTDYVTRVLLNPGSGDESVRAKKEWKKYAYKKLEKSGENCVLWVILVAVLVASTSSTSSTLLGTRPSLGNFLKSYWKTAGVLWVLQYWALPFLSLWLLDHHRGGINKVKVRQGLRDKIEAEAERLSYPLFDIVVVKSGDLDCYQDFDVTNMAHTIGPPTPETLFLIESESGSKSYTLVTESSDSSMSPEAGHWRNFDRESFMADERIANLMNPQLDINGDTCCDQHRSGAGACDNLPRKKFLRKQSRPCFECDIFLALQGCQRTAYYKELKPNPIRPKPETLKLYRMRDKYAAAPHFPCDSLKPIDPGCCL
ncbi:unnamed protein product, partial [Notodromas monacha]